MFFESSGASHTVLSGRINHFHVDISGATQGGAKNLIANNVHLDIAGAADIDVYAKNSFKIDASRVAHVIALP